MLKEKEGERRLHVIEGYVNAQAVLEHQASPYFRAFAAGLDALLRSVTEASAADVDVSTLAGRTGCGMRSHLER